MIWLLFMPVCAGFIVFASVILIEVWWEVIRPHTGFFPKADVYLAIALTLVAIGIPPFALAMYRLTH